MQVTVRKRIKFSISFMFSSKLDSSHQATRTGDLCTLHSQDRIDPCFSLFLSCHRYRYLSLDYGRMLISELMVIHLNGRMVNTHNRRGDPEPDLPNGNPPPPPTLAQAIASIFEFQDEQTELLRQLVANSTLAHGGNGARNNHAQAPTTYGDFATTHPLLFTEAREPLEADNWLHVIESKFGLLHCTETLKTLFTAQQLREDACAWWANYIATSLTNYQVPWGEFREAFRAHHIPTGIMRRKHQEFMDLKQGKRSVHEYSKLFNHLAQYAPKQVDTDEKKNDHFMNGLSTKLQERLALSLSGTFLDFISNAIIVDDKIHAHKESKKRKAMVASSSNTPPEYRVMYPPPRPTYQPRQPYR
jgi:hypothetical protein